MSPKLVESLIVKLCCTLSKYFCDPMSAPVPPITTTVDTRDTPPITNMKRCKKIVYKIAERIPILRRPEDEFDTNYADCTRQLGIPKSTLKDWKAFGIMNCQHTLENGGKNSRSCKTIRIVGRKSKWTAMEQDLMK